MKLRHPIAGLSRYRCRPALVLTVVEAIGVCAAAFLVTFGLVLLFAR